MIEAPPGPGWWQALDGQWHGPDTYPAYIPARPMRNSPWFLVLVIVAVAVAGTVLQNFVVGQVNRLSTTPISIVYTVTGDGVAIVTYDTFPNGDKATVHTPMMVPPWTMKVEGHRPLLPFTVDLTVENQSPIATPLNCVISVNGIIVSRHTVDASYATLRCSASYL